MLCLLLFVKQQQIGKIIGKGGFGTVHKGRNLNTGTAANSEKKNEARGYARLTFFLLYLMTTCRRDRGGEVLPSGKDRQGEHVGRDGTSAIMSSQCRVCASGNDNGTDNDNPRRLPRRERQSCSCVCTTPTSSSSTAT